MNKDLLESHLAVDEMRMAEPINQIPKASFCLDGAYGTYLTTVVECYVEAPKVAGQVLLRPGIFILNLSQYTSVGHGGSRCLILHISATITFTISSSHFKKFCNP